MIPPTTRLVLFDAGFTLVETVEPVADVYLREARALGVGPPESAFRERLGDLWTRLHRDYRSANADLASSDELELAAWREFTFELARPFPSLTAVHSEWVERLFHRFDDPSAWRLVEDADVVLISLRERGVTIGIASNWHSALHNILRGLGVDQLVDFTLTSAEVGHKKPHRRIFEEALRRSDVAPDQTVHVGDSWRDDVEGARSVGIRPIHFSRSRSTSEDTDGVTVIERLTALVD